MQTLALCESLIGFYPKNRSAFLRSPPPFPSPRKHRKNSRRISFRYMLEQPQDGKTEEILLRSFQHAPSSNTHSNEMKCFGNNSSKNTMQLVARDRHLMDKSLRAVTFGSRIFTSSSTKHDRGSLSDICTGLKMMILIGLFTFQGPQQAVAGTELAGGMQSLALFGDLGDISTGFASAFLLIFFSELGDKTFFIAALLAARNSGAVVFIGTFGALAAMTLVSVILGRTFHYVDGILPFRFGETDIPIDDYAAVCLLIYFGVTTLLDASSSDELKMKEEQKEAAIAVSELTGNGAGIIAAANTVVSTFLLVFVAEWGDKSFFSTIALAAASSPLGVIGGALAGHAFATLLAVIGGSLLGTFFSEKVLAYIGGILFLVFAVITLIETVS